MDHQLTYAPYIWTAWGISAPAAEFQFHSKRMWRFDAAWVNEKVAVEIDGAIWKRGRHNQPRGMLNDNEKINTAQLMGWKVFRFSPKQLHTGEAQNFMREVLK